MSAIPTKTVENFAETNRSRLALNDTTSTLQNPQINIAPYLQNLCNKYGDFKVARAWRNEEGEMLWSKHRSVMEVWETEWGINWLATVNNRQILPCEVVLDFDNNPTLNEINKICDELEKRQEKYEAYFTGSKGYHIHIMDNTLLELPKHKRELIKELFIKSLGADLMKKNDVMIALENAPHWKTGRKKTLIRRWPEWEK